MSANINRYEKEYAFDRAERFRLDPDSPVPLYHQMEQVLIDRIKQDGMVGKMLPSEAELMDMFGVSRVTVKKAVENLANLGLVDRRRAIGTRITRPQITEDLTRLTSYTEEMSRKGFPSGRISCLPASTIQNPRCEMLSALEKTKKLYALSV